MNKYLTVEEAANLANVTVSTIRNWAKDFKIGHKSGGRWTIIQEGLEQILAGELHYTYRYQKKGKSIVNKQFGEMNA